MDANRRKGCRLSCARQPICPEAFGLEQDICDVTLWLVEKLRIPGIHVWVFRHDWHRGRQMSGVSVIMPRGYPDRHVPEARYAFLALGYEIDDTGAAIYPQDICNGKHARHQALAAFGRIETALETWRRKGAPRHG